MSFIRPQVAEIQQRVIADLSARLGLESIPAQSVLRAIATAQAGASHELHGYAAWIARQIHPATCDDAILPRWAALYGVDRLGAITASGKIAVRGKANAEVLAESALQGSNGIRYQCTSSYKFDADGEIQIEVIALTVGSVANLPREEKLTFVHPRSGIESQAVVCAAIGGGADEESIANWRQRVTDIWTAKKERGDKDDYANWARAAHPDVTHAWVQEQALGVGSVVVRPITNDLDARIPNAATIAAVDDYLQAHRPVGIRVEVQPPLEGKVNFAIQIKNAAQNTQANKDAVAANLKALIRSHVREEALITQSSLSTAIEKTFAVTDYKLVQPLGDVQMPVNALAVMGEVNWQ